MTEVELIAESLRSSQRRKYPVGKADTPFNERELKGEEVGIQPQIPLLEKGVPSEARRGIYKKIPRQVITCHPSPLLRHCEVSQRETEAISY
ncbi:MAG: hypothetical protein ACP5KZ_09815 [bacterium]